MTAVQTAGVWLGAADWERPDWTGGFYPADMPEEWRLAYYNTQFSSVWLPQSRWVAADLALVRQWREDTHAGFRFVLEQPPILDGHAQVVLDTLGDRVWRVCQPEDSRLLWFDAGTDLKDLTATIRARSGDGPLYLLSRDGDLATLERVATLLGLLGL